MNKSAKFNIGDLVMHRRIRYRAIVVDVDPIFQASGQYNPQAHKHEFATRHPWYRLLVDDSSQMTYVEENMLIAAPDQQPINNPNLHQYFSGEEGHYKTHCIKH